VLAHRGASGLAPENTLPAVQRARDLGVDGVEVDVQRTSDGVLVLVHDDTWMRTAGLDAAVAATPWEAVRGLDAGSWFGSEFAATPPPRLDDLLVLARAGLFCNLEIKSPEKHPGLGDDVVAAVRRSGAGANVLMTCFDAGVVETLARAHPDLAFGYLAAQPPLRDDPAVRAQSLLADWILREPGLVKAAHAAGRKIYSWSVDDPATWRRLARLGVDGIITNHPERFVRAPARRF
jgi:glycerophosphoryl diester phosphodiesterase